jgi:hypothetical protein
MFHTLPAERSRRVGRVRHRGQHTVQADDFTHVCGVVVRGLVMWRGGEEEKMSRATRWAEDGLVRWRRRCGRGRCLLAWSVGQGPMRGLLCGAALEALASAIPVPLGKGGTSANGLTNRVVRSTISTAVKCSKYSLVSSHVIVPGYSRCEVNAMLYVT